MVLDKAVADDFLRERLGKAIGLNTVRKFVGRRLTVPNLEDYKIVGIVDTESPSLFVDKSQMMYILSNADEVELGYGILGVGEEDAAADVVKNGTVRDLDLTENEIKITKGKKPKKVNETIINAYRRDEVELGKTVNVMLRIKPVMNVNFEGKLIAQDKVAGRKRSLKAMAERYETTADRSRWNTVFIAHGDCEEDAEYLAEKVREINPDVQIRFQRVGTIIGCHTGPGIMTLFFWSNQPR